MGAAAVAAQPPAASGKQQRGHARHHAAAAEQQQFGAAMTPRQFALIVVGLGCGTMLEWYDFFSYSQLNETLTKVFFPASSATAQQLAFWAVYFVGFIARPLGSLIFGAIGDTRGRRLTLLLTICIMAVPTVLIGALPTYAQVGVAAPILLSILRLIQGLAMGGELGSALVYLHEVSDAAHKGLVSAIGFASSILGCTLGVLVVLVLELIFSPDQMLLFGWRIPFLLSSVSALAALLLRLHMPEPHEFVQDRAAAIEHTLRRASGLSPSPSRRASSSMGSQLGSPLPSAALDLEVAVGSPAHDAPAAPHARHPAPLPRLDEAAAAAAKLGDAGAGGSAQLPAGPHNPIAELFREHWAGVLLQFVFEAWPSIAFYLLASWLPLQMHKALGMPVLLTRVMLIINLLVTVAGQLGAGRAVDAGLPRLYSAGSVYVLSAAITVPVFLGFGRGSIAGCWLLHALMMALVGWVLGLIPAACSPIYPPAVRLTGFNLGHNLSMSWLGGLAPTILTALVAATHSSWLAPGILLAVTAVVSLIAAVALLFYAPASNRTPAEPQSGPAGGDAAAHV